MNLAEWSKQSKILPTTPTTEYGAVSVVIGHNNAHDIQLWHLSDYNVSSVCGVVIWLVPR